MMLIQNEVNNKTITRLQRILWITHFFLSFAVLVIGVNRNGGRKFVPAKIDSMNIDKSCERIYVNVLSTSVNDNDAYICCSELNSDSNLSLWNILFSDYEYGLCSRRVKLLPLVKYLSRFPQSWIIPIFPLLIRLIMILSTLILSIMSSKCTPIPLKSKLSTSIKRFFFYFCIMQFRGWILYIFINDIIMKEFIGNMMGISISAMGQQLQQQEQKKCWFTKHLRRNFDLECHGQQFDFSDHIVLFHAHFLPIMIMEAIVCYRYPLWSFTSNATTASIDQQNLEKRWSSFNIYKTFVSGMKMILLTSVLVWFGYVSFIVYISAISTATYFHTVPESIVGYLLSLTVQLPIGLVVAGGIRSSKLTKLRSFVGLESDREHMD